MHPWALLQAMVLLALANGTPVVAKRVFGQRFAWPLDGNVTWFDRRRLLGPSKTIRGIVLSLLTTTIAAPFIGLSAWVGCLSAGAAMAGDLCSSFVKRRLNFAASTQLLGVDQLPESLLPLLALRGALALSAADIGVGVAGFLIGELVLSRLLYKIHLRDEPY
jgi:CDP-2,3-bis-(O-geranylgeranyl)-sn-glycerol synthase